MSRIYSLYLADIVESCEKIQTYVSDMTFDEFLADRKTTDAVVRNLEIIGEAVKNIPEEIRSLRPEVEWKRVARFRDIIAHHYFRIDYDRVWSLTQHKIDVIKTATEELLVIRLRTEDID